jgi:hypothetical protein
MNAEIEIEARSLRALESRLSHYRKEIGKTHAELMIGLGKSVARQLAMKTQPYGLSDSVGKKYQGSIRGQVERSLANANLSAGSGSVSQEHKARRDGRGRVPKGLQEKGQFQRIPFEIQERKNYAKLKAANAGMLKAAWINAGNALGGSKLSDIKKWISENMRSAQGSAKIITGGFFKHHEIWLTNAMKYAGRALRRGDMKSALNAGFLNFRKSMEIALQSKVEKLDRIERLAK